ncbi:integrase arm-type DNA-binding domain-containing protein [Hydrogenophaga sp.]|uniref:tyrosine-type recombinase/integrase n=1 Tax=Hydrogenophaga sp. TaxID=1904254 RepID=UPI002BCF44C1|nr:integrase arm-type DNA-binding domain-containing protein [Hydrogenophaga sp.]HMP11580.1 integrase arm-type DNA-binding domain-containing protein [Hydrogenophaga sp.]
MPATDLLTDKAIQATFKAVTAAGKARKLSDGAGLVLDVRPTGSGWWRLRFWRDGKEGMLSLGTYPDVTLKAARRKRDEARAAWANGEDLSERRKAEKAERARKRQAEDLEAAGLPGPGTFEFVAREWLENKHRPAVSEGHAKTTQTRLEKMVFPWLGRRPIGEIEPPELLACLRKIEARGALETTHRVKDACSQVFRFGVSIGVCARNPAADLREALKPVPVRHFAAVVDPDGTKKLLRDIAGYRGNPVTCAALQLSALLLLRPGELRRMEWGWVDFGTSTLTVPSEMMKRRRYEKEHGPDHIVPLAPQAVAILKELHPLTEHSRYVFPSLLTREKPMSDNTVRSALRRLGYGNDEMTAHGFRAMARTLIAEELEVAPEVIEAQLAHQVSDPLGRAYNRTQYLAQRREMMTKWADYLDQLQCTTEGS